MKHLFIAILLLVTLSANSKSIGYMVYVSNKEAKNTEYYKTQSLEKVNSSLASNTGLHINVEKMMGADNLFFEYRNNGLYYYCEKRIVHRKKNGRLVYRKIKQKDLKALAAIPQNNTGN